MSLYEAQAEVEAIGPSGASGEVPVKTLCPGQGFKLLLETRTAPILGHVVFQSTGMTTVALDEARDARTITTREGETRTIAAGVARRLTTWAPSTLVVASNGFVDAEELYQRRASQPGEEGGQVAKKGKKKKAEASGQPHYAVTEKDAAKLGPQAAIVHAGVKAVGPADAARVTQNCGARLKTKQDPIRVVSYYLSQLKASGHLKRVDPPASATAA